MTCDIQIICFFPALEDTHVLVNSLILLISKVSVSAGARDLTLLENNTLLSMSIRTGIAWSTSNDFLSRTAEQVRMT